MGFTNLGNDFNIYNMKYLKRFKESVDKSNIDTDDMDFRFSFEGELTGVIIRVVSYTDTPLKMNDEVKDEFIRMVDYLESLGINSVKSIYVREGSNYRFEEDFSDFIILEEVELRNLLFVAKVN